MCLPPDDKRFLEQALSLARDAAAFASPNPTVGCVLTREGQVIGEGAHFYDNRDHAEIAALKQAASLGHVVQGATAYVTLEPCAHHGRTGPCASALVAAQIARCVVATVDPNPLVSGQGIAILRAAGVEVVVAEPSSKLAQQARRLNDAFAFSIQHNRPFVTLKAAVSRDGYLAPPPEARITQEPVWLTGAQARGDVQALRHASDAILTGIGTVLADNPSLTDRTDLPRRRKLLRVVLDAKLRIPLSSKLLRDVADDLLIATAIDASEEREAAIRALGAEVVRLPQASESTYLDLRALLHELHARHIRSLLLEAGSAVNSSFLQADLVDRAVIYQSPLDIDSGAIPFALHGPSVAELQNNLTEQTVQGIPRDEASSDEDKRVSGYLHDPWNGIAINQH